MLGVAGAWFKLKINPDSPPYLAVNSMNQCVPIACMGHPDASVAYFAPARAVRAVRTYW